MLEVAPPRVQAGDVTYKLHSPGLLVKFGGKTSSPFSTSSHHSQVRR